MMPRNVCASLSRRWLFSACGSPPSSTAARSLRRLVASLGGRHLLGVGYEHAPAMTMSAVCDDPSLTDAVSAQFSNAQAEALQRRVEDDVIALAIG